MVRSRIKAAPPGQVILHYGGVERMWLSGEILCPPYLPKPKAVIPTERSERRDLAAIDRTLVNILHLLNTGDKKLNFIGYFFSHSFFITVFFEILRQLIIL